MKLPAEVEGLERGHRQRIASALELMYLQSERSARLQGRVEGIEKEDRSPVTVIDLLHQSQFQQLLAERFVDDGLICEEPRSLQEQLLAEARRVSSEEYGIELADRVLSRPVGGQVTWILDPIDGTKGFLGGRCFAIAAGYFEGEKPYFSAVACPGRDPREPRSIDSTLSFAVGGVGAWSSEVEGGSDAEWSPLRSAPWPGERLRVAVSLAHGGPMVDRLQAADGLEVVKLDSQAKYVAVAMGTIDAYLRAKRDDGVPDLLWDHLPGALIALESGCGVTHFEGGEVEFRPRAAVDFTGGVICSRRDPSGALQARLQALTSG